VSMLTHAHTGCERIVTTCQHRHADTHTGIRCVTVVTPC